eukprot:51170-Karenia_brevis.AAC.1
MQGNGCTLSRILRSTTASIKTSSSLQYCTGPAILCSLRKLPAPCVKESLTDTGIIAWCAPGAGTAPRGTI